MQNLILVKNAAYSLVKHSSLPNRAKSCKRIWAKGGWLSCESLLVGTVGGHNRLISTNMQRATIVFSFQKLMDNGGCILENNRQIKT